MTYSTEYHGHTKDLVRVDGLVCSRMVARGRAWAWAWVRLVIEAVAVVGTVGAVLVAVGAVGAAILNAQPTEREENVEPREP